MQEWRWHETSNGREYGLANTVMNFCTPEFYDVHRVQYESQFPNYNITYDLSVSVVEKVAHTMKSYTLTMLASPLDFSAVFLILSWVRCVFSLVYVVCEQEKLRVSDFHFKNIGLTEKLQLVLIDIEQCTEAPDKKAKQRAVPEITPFLAELSSALVDSTADASWLGFRLCFHNQIESWWSQLHEVPSHAAIDCKFKEAIDFTHRHLRLSPSPPPPPPPSDTQHPNKPLVLPPHGAGSLATQDGDAN